MAFYPAMSMGDRILFVRENCGDLSQEEFANKLGLTKSAISGYETGRRIPPDNVLKHIACVFHLDEDWLKDGVGEPFFPTPEDALEELFAQFECSGFERSFLRAYFYLQDNDRIKFSKYLEQIFDFMVMEAKEKESRSTTPEPVTPAFAPWEEIAKAETDEQKPAAGTPSDVANTEALYEKNLGFAPSTDSSASNTTGGTASPSDKPKDETTEENGGGESGDDVG